jgi:3-oxoacyl-[acyl-carrier protein] reductase
MLSFNLLEGKTALITGASKGIGREVARIFAKNGANLILISRDEQRLNALKNELLTYNVEVIYYTLDITDSNSLKEIFSKIKKTKQKIDSVVNNAGIMEDAVLQMVKPDMIHKIYATNVFALIDISKRVSKLMLKNRKGSIINLTSIIGVEGNLGQTIYGSSKSAVIGFTKSLSKELASLNIRVNAVAPGFIDTDMTRGMDEKFYKKNLESIGLGRLGSTEDVAKVILFLASDLSDYVTGQIIGVDGGMVI